MEQKRQPGRRQQQNEEKKNKCSALTTCTDTKNAIAKLSTIHALHQTEKGKKEFIKYEKLAKIEDLHNSIIDENGDEILCALTQRLQSDDHGRSAALAQTKKTERKQRIQTIEQK